MTHRVYNFCPGPATLPVPVLERAQKELLDFQGTGMSIIETSHRAESYDKVHQGARTRIKKLLNVPDAYEVLFMIGGASQQFALIPMNFRSAGKGACEYVNTGIWATKAIEQAEIQDKETRVVASSEDKNFNYLPKDISFGKDACYVHMTSNNTVVGTQYQTFPKTPAPLICDMSSDILSRALDFSQFHLIYAGAQKNMGPAGVTIVIARKDFIEGGADGLPSIMSYKTHLKGNSLYNTPPAFTIYMVGLVLEWLEGEGGVSGIQKKNEAKAAILYEKLDSSDFYRGTASKEDRSLMNVTFRLPSEKLEEKFCIEAEAAGLSGLKGHRSVGGCRASIYNAFPKEGVVRLVEFMDQFEKANR